MAFPPFFPVVFFRHLFPPFSPSFFRPLSRCPFLPFSPSSFPAVANFPLYVHSGRAGAVCFYPLGKTKNRTPKSPVCLLFIDVLSVPGSYCPVCTIRSVPGFVLSVSGFVRSGLLLRPSRIFRNGDQSRNPSRTNCSRIFTQSATGRFTPSTKRIGQPRLLSSI